MSEPRARLREPEKIRSIDAEFLAGQRFPYQEDIALVEDVDLVAARRARTSTGSRTSTCSRRTACPRCSTATRTRSSRSTSRSPPGREDEIARKVLITHLQSGNSYGIQLKEKHTKFPQPELGPWVEGSRTVGTDWKPPVLEGWESPPGTELRRRIRRRAPGRHVRVVLQHIACEPPGVYEDVLASAAPSPARRARRGRAAPGAARLRRGGRAWAGR